MRRPLAWCAAIAVGAACSSHSEPTGSAVSQAPPGGIPGGAPVAVSVRVAPDTAVVVAGNTLRLSAAALDAAGQSIAATVRWVTSDSGVAGVDQSGTVLARRRGNVTISAATQGVSGSARVEVVAPARDSSIARAGDSVVTVVVGSGSSVTVPVAAFGAGAVVTAEEVPAPPLGADWTPASATALRVSVRAASGGARAALVAANGAAVRFPLRITRSQLASATSRASDVAYSAVLAAGDAATAVVVKAASVTERVGATGRRYLDATFVDPIVRGATAVGTTAGGLAYELQFVSVVADASCEPSTWAMYPWRRASTSANKIPLVLVHGWQPQQTTCRAANAFTPDASDGTWGTLLGVINDDPRLRDRFEPWLFRYPTFLPVSDAARQLAQSMGKLAGRDVVVVAHSMGGLVTARYMADESSNRVRELDALGTPFGGSPLAAQVGLDGDKIAAYIACTAGIGTALDLALGSVFLSTAGANDLLPTGPFISTLNGDATRFSGRLHVFAGSANWGAAFVRAQGVGASAFVHDAGGCLLQAIGRGPSDGIVPLSSATAVGAVSTVSVPNVRHDMLPQDPTVIAGVRARLLALASSVPSAATRLSPVSGDRQRGAAGGALAAPLVVRVTDSAGVGVPGVAVEFRVSAGNGRVAATSTSDASGEVRATWTLGTTGVDTVTASATGLAGSPVRFTVGAGTCVATSRLTTPFTVNGAISASSCLFEGKPSLVYSLDVSAQTIVRLTMQPSAFQPWLRVRLSGSADGTDYYRSTSGASLDVRWLLPAGSYVMAAGAYVDDGTGTFQLTGLSIGENVTGCAVTTLPPISLTTRQTLTSTDCGTSAFYDYYTLYSGNACTITMRSAAFDAYLEVYDSDGRLIARDDDSGGGTDARITLAACRVSGPTVDRYGGLYVKARSYGTNETGAYTLALSATPALREEPLVEPLVEPLAAAPRPGTGATAEPKRAPANASGEPPPALPAKIGARQRAAQPRL